MEHWNIVLWQNWLTGAVAGSMFIAWLAGRDDRPYICWAAVNLPITGLWALLLRPPCA